ncbi:hypothetical protein TVAG_262750 [Trichomonas vaginalis G3]|uniref:ATPase V1 complex subunit H C-terminal domain-containing protein n=1 Tax=Trichomonas vaginalis (strain ATCC PRA-98 / G3) TaxID=412133 RepID=A2FS41_TRIV3|nr:proton-transporting ATPase activity, rotational mechanism [Trichomonas vaginalis G3]EAX92283.1 hypothetical protein TVAG_262750 [Trichomonas vaginalis G3]KAI5530132.1 proton-transporting ATPase activity, rotational mechanism [Trichomonas vaginalis G3]|eukprot:XP_001305213.1 hypothetical protein [Trichomonas vaginalis G3]
MQRSKHPLFVRLEQRDAIFRDGNPASLSLESENAEDCKAFVSLFQASPENQLTEFVKNKNHAEIFTKLLSTRSDPAPLNLLCAFIDRLLDLDFNATIGALMANSQKLSEGCAKILIGHTADHLNQAFLVRTILLLLGTIISERDTKATTEAFQTFTRTALSLLSAKLNEASIALECVKRALRSEQFRSTFISEKGTKLLLDLLTQAQKASNTDSLYHILFCIWGISFSAEGAGQLSEGDFIPILTKLLSTVQPEREELVRLLTFIIQQLNPSIVFIENAYDYDILRLVRNLQTKHYVDPELTTEIAKVADDMAQALKKLSLWDKYVREVKSGKLKNTISHSSELFWKANVERFGENNFAVLIALRDLLKSDDEETVTVACHDIGEYVHRHPLGRIKVEEIHAKEMIMELLINKNQNIVSQALRTTQLLLLRNN